MKTCRTCKEEKEPTEFYGRACLIPDCEATQATLDHVIPLSRGGMHVVGNAQPLCISHNSSKGARDTTDYRTTIWLERLPSGKDIIYTLYRVS